MHTEFTTTTTTTYNNNNNNTTNDNNTNTHSNSHNRVVPGEHWADLPRSLSMDSI